MVQNISTTDLHTSPYLPTYSPITSGYTRKLGTHTTHSLVLILPYSCLTPAMLLSCFYLTLALILTCSFLPCFCINPTQLLSSPSLAPWPLFASFLLLVSTLTLFYSAVLVLLWSCVADVLPVVFLLSYTSPTIPILLMPCPSCRFKKCP